MGKVKHYNKYPIETIDMMIAIWGEAKVAEWCLLTAFKYRMRLGLKQSETIESDMKKEDYYIEKYKELRGCIIEDEFAENLFSQLETKEKEEKLFIEYIIPEESIYSETLEQIEVNKDFKIFEFLENKLNTSYIICFKLNLGIWEVDVLPDYILENKEMTYKQVIESYCNKKEAFDTLIKINEIKIEPILKEYQNINTSIDKEVNKEEKQQRYITFTDNNNRIAVSDDTQLFKVLLADMKANENIAFFNLKAGMFDLEITKTVIEKYEDFNLIEIIDFYSVNKKEFELFTNEKEIKITPVYYNKENEEIKKENKKFNLTIIEKILNVEPIRTNKITKENVDKDFKIVKELLGYNLTNVNHIVIKFGNTKIEVPKETVNTENIEMTLESFIRRSGLMLSDKGINNMIEKGLLLNEERQAFCEFIYN